MNQIIQSVSGGKMTMHHQLFCLLFAKRNRADHVHREQCNVPDHTPFEPSLSSKRPSLMSKVHFIARLKAACYQCSIQKISLSALHTRNNPLFFPYNGPKISELCSRQSSPPMYVTIYPLFPKASLGDGGSNEHHDEFYAPPKLPKSW